MLGAVASVGQEERLVDHAVLHIVKVLFLRVVGIGDLAEVITIYAYYLPKHASWQTFCAFWRGQLCETVNEDE